MVMKTELPRAAEAPVMARRFLETHYQNRLRRSTIADAQLIASELVSNAVEHGCGRISLTADLAGDRLRVEVVDEGTGQAPAIRAQGGAKPGGWGLRIVDELALRWGAHEGTTHVWAELPAR